MRIRLRSETVRASVDGLPRKTAHLVWTDSQKILQPGYTGCLPGRLLDVSKGTSFSDGGHVAVLRFGKIVDVRVIAPLRPAQKLHQTVDLIIVAPMRKRHQFVDETLYPGVVIRFVKDAHASGLYDG